MFIVILKLHLPILKETLVSSCYTQKGGSCDNLRLNTPSIYLQCTGQESVSDSESNVCFKQRQRNNYTFMSWFYFKAWLCTSSFYNL